VCSENNKLNGYNELRERVRERVLILFDTSQCSWCKLFYTKPFLCVKGSLHSNCFSFKELSKTERVDIQIGVKEWVWRAYEMVLRVEDQGVLSRCRKCGVLNPNPDKYVCWQCGEDLCCPEHKTSVLKYDIYDISGDYWKCRDSACRKKFSRCTICGQATLVRSNKHEQWECTHCYAFGPTPETVVEFNPEIFYKPKAFETDIDRKPHHAHADYPEPDNKLKNLTVNSAKSETTIITPNINFSFGEATKVSPSKLKLIDNRDQVDCPIKKEGGFPCPRCQYSVKTSQRAAFLNTTTWWYCQYPNQDKYVTP